jgi:hypothetical protein
MRCIRVCARETKFFFSTGITNFVERWTKRIKKGGWGDRLCRKMTHFFLVCNFFRIWVLAYCLYLLSALRIMYFCVECVNKSAVLGNILCFIHLYPL